MQHTFLSPFVFKFHIMNHKHEPIADSVKSSVSSASVLSISFFLKWPRRRKRSRTSGVLTLKMHNYHSCHDEDLCLYISCNLKFWVKPPWWGRDCPCLFTGLGSDSLNSRPQQGCVIFCTVTWCCHLQCVQTSFIAILGCLQPEGTGWACRLVHPSWIIWKQRACFGVTKRHLSTGLLRFLILSFSNIELSSLSISHSINCWTWIPNLETYGGSFQVTCFPFLLSMSFGVSPMTSILDSCPSDCSALSFLFCWTFFPCHNTLSNQNLILRWETGFPQGCWCSFALFKNSWNTALCTAHQKCKVLLGTSQCLDFLFTTKWSQQFPTPCSKLTDHHWDLGFFSNIKLFILNAEFPKLFNSLKYFDNKTKMSNK